jgi:hypothetical protein
MCKLEAGISKQSDGLKSGLFYPSVYINRYSYLNSNHEHIELKLILLGTHSFFNIDILSHFI